MMQYFYTANTKERITAGHIHADVYNENKQQVTFVVSTHLTLDWKKLKVISCDQNVDKTHLPSSFLN